MPKAVKKNEAKFTAWTATGMRMEASGNVAGCALELFGCVAGAELREKLLRQMQERHDKLTEAGV